MRFALLIAGLAALGPFSVDTYFPSFPAIGEHFGVGPVKVQSTLTVYLVALAWMSLFHGAVSDSFGRRRVILVTQAIYAVTAFGCVLAPNFTALLALRFTQGAAAGAGMIVARAVIRDRFDNIQSQKFMAEVTMISSFAPAVAPVIGGWLHIGFGWRGPFVFLGILGSLVFIACWFGMPESLPPSARQSFHPANLARNYWDVIRNPKFLALCIATSLGGGGFLLYVATAPDVVLNILKLTETQFAWMFVPIVMGMALGSAVTARLSHRVDPLKLIRYGYAFMALAVVANLSVNIAMTPRVPWAVMPLAFYSFGFALFAPGTTILCLDIFPTKRGLASSLQGFGMMLVFSLISATVAPLVYASGAKHALVMAAMLALNWLAWRWYRACS